MSQFRAEAVPLRDDVPVGMIHLLKGHVQPTKKVRSIVGSTNRRKFAPVALSDARQCLSKRPGSSLAAAMFNATISGLSFSPGSTMPIEGLEPLPSRTATPLSAISQLPKATATNPPPLPNYRQMFSTMATFKTSIAGSMNQYADGSPHSDFNGVAKENFLQCEKPVDHRFTGQLRRAFTPGVGTPGGIDPLVSRTMDASRVMRRKRSILGARPAIGFFRTVAGIDRHLHSKASNGEREAALAHFPPPPAPKHREDIIPYQNTMWITQPPATAGMHVEDDKRFSAKDRGLNNTIVQQLDRTKRELATQSRAERRTIHERQLLETIAAQEETEESRLRVRVQNKFEIRRNIEAQFHQNIWREYARKKRDMPIPGQRHSSTPMPQLPPLKE